MGKEKSFCFCLDTAVVTVPSGQTELQVDAHFQNQNVCMYVCMYVRTYVCMYVCMPYVCMYVCMNVCACVCVRTYVHIYVIYRLGGPYREKLRR